MYVSPKKLCELVSLDRGVAKRGQWHLLCMLIVRLLSAELGELYWGQAPLSYTGHCNTEYKDLAFAAPVQKKVGLKRWHS